MLENEATDIVLAEAAAGPLDVADRAAGIAVGEERTAAGVAMHPAVEHGAGADIADDIQTGAADMLNGDVADRPIMDEPVGAIGHDLDAVAVAAAAPDREVGECEIGEVDAGRDVDLNDRRAVGDVGDDSRTTKIDADRTLSVLGDVDDDRRRDGIRVVGPDDEGTVVEGLLQQGGEFTHRTSPASLVVSAPFRSWLPCSLAKNLHKALLCRCARAQHVAVSIIVMPPPMRC